MDSVGVAAIGAVLVVGTVAGMWRRRTDGRLRDVATVPAGREILPDVHEQPGMTDVNGRPGVTDVNGQPGVIGVDERPGVIDAVPEDPSAGGARLDPALLAELGVTPAKATLLQFSSAFCAPCRAVRRVSSEVADLIPGVRHVEVDAESHLEAVRALGIWRTPTLLVLDADGRVVKRATGVPGKPQLIAVLGGIL